GWGVGVSVSQLKHQLSWMQPLKPTLSLLISHQDQVSQPPADSVIWAESAFCPIYMILVGDTTLGIQGHPEFSKAYARDLMQRLSGLIPDDVVKRGLESLDMPLDDQLFGAWVLKFSSAGTWNHQPVA